MAFSNALSPVDNSPQFIWRVTLEKSGSANVTGEITNIGQSNLIIFVPTTCENFEIAQTSNYTQSLLPHSSYDEITVSCENISQLNVSYVWPDAAVQYNEKFYFAGDEKPVLGQGKVSIYLPENSSVSWVEGVEDFSGNFTDELNFALNSSEPIPSFAYSLSNMPQVAMKLETSSHVNLTFHPIMNGKPWVIKTLELIESQWDWMKATLKSEADSVNVTFVPYGYNNLGITNDGFCYFGSRNIEIVATEQFGIGVDGSESALLFHEVTHALTPFFEAGPTFYSEAIAQQFSYDTLRRTDLNLSVEYLEETQFNFAYEYGVEEGLFNYIYDWPWGNEINRNTTISDACYGTVTFIGDFFVHQWGFNYYYKLLDVFNSTEINALPETQKLPKFLDYLSVSCGCNITQLLGAMQFKITRWFDAYTLRNDFLNFELDPVGPFTQSAQGTITDMINNATNAYEERDFESAINEFNQVNNTISSLRNQDAAFFRNIAFIEVVLFAIIVLSIIVLYRRKSRYYF